jgi:hypothetical protein
VYITQQTAQFFKSRRVEPSEFFQAVLRPSTELVRAPLGLSYTDDRHVEVAPLSHGLQRRKDFLVGQVAGGTEKNKRVRLGIIHVHAFQAA